MAEPKPTLSGHQLLAAAASGLLLTGCFPKIGHPALALFALVPLLLALRGVSFSGGFRLGFITGLVHFTTLVYWAAYTMRIYGHLPLYLCIPLLILFSAYLSIYPALFAGATTLIQRPAARLILIPIFWTAAEYLRAILFTGFPWELLGYSQYRNLAFIQIADITGIYGVSFWLALVNAALFLACVGFRQQLPGKVPITRKAAAGALLTALAVSGLLWGYGRVRIAAVDREAAAATYKNIAVVQGNIDQGNKWDRKFQKATLSRYNELSSRAGRDRPDLIVWPETATPFFIGHNRTMTGLLFEGIRRTQSGYLIGAPTAVRHKNRTAYHNSAILFDEQARVIDSYNKVHLVPFGEYVPFKQWLPFIGKMVAQVGDFIPGQAGKAIAWRKMHLGIQICYEIIFPELSRTMVQNGANILVNITNDAWFGKTGAPAQHFSMAVFRAIENRRSLARAANTGISGFIDPAGRMASTSRLNTAAALTLRLPLMSAKTFYTANGDLFALGCLLVSFFITGRAFFDRYGTRKRD